MSRVLVLVEGQTERAVIQKTVGEYLALHGIYIYPRVIGKPGHKGGNNFEKALSEIINLMKQEPDSVITTFFDYYGLPNDWPGRQESTHCTQITQKPRIIEDAVKKAVENKLNDQINPSRFLPYIQMHELEALLFSGPRVMADVFQAPSLTNKFEEIVQQCGGCEEINDNSETAPSKRINNLYPGYKKGSSVNSHAPLIIQKIGIDPIRSQCPHFDDWITALIALKSQQ